MYASQNRGRSCAGNYNITHGGIKWKRKYLKWDGVVLYKLIQAPVDNDKNQAASYRHRRAPPNAHSDVTKAADNNQTIGRVEPD